MIALVTGASSGIGAAVARRLAAEPGLTQVASYWSLDAPSLRSEDRRQALVLARITGDEEALDERAKQLTAAYTAEILRGAIRAVPFGEVDTELPYQAAWSTLTAANGAYTWTAVARDGAGRPRALRRR